MPPQISWPTICPLPPRDSASLHELSGPSSGTLRVFEQPAVYRPRHPERQVFYQIFDQHFERFLGVHEERFESRSGPLRPVVKKCVDAFLDCGRLKSGFARLRCQSCKGEHLLAFSCQTRNFCPSCQAKRSALFAEKLEEEILAKVPHRHFVFTIPIALRGLFERDRRLLGLLSRCAFLATKKYLQTVLDQKDVLPGMVTSIQTFGSFAANFNPHIHAIVSDGGWLQNGSFLPLPSIDSDALCEIFRRLVIDGLFEKERLSERFRDSLLTWVRPGFSVYARQVIAPEDSAQIAHIARYLTRPPLRLDSLSITPEGLVSVQTPPDPRSGKASLTLDPIDWIQRVTTQIPDQGSHATRYYGAYANRTSRSQRAKDQGSSPAAKTPRHPNDSEPHDEDQDSKARRRSWARLLRKLFEVDPLLCPRCLKPLKLVAVITEPKTVDKILAHIQAGGGHDPFEARAPPAA